MQQLLNATAVFCTACILAEVVAQFTQKGWPRRCIKAVAGLYILVALGRSLPQEKQELTAFSLPQAAAVSVGTLEQATILQAQSQLEEDLARRCRDTCGIAAEIQVTLTETSAGWAAAEVEAILPPGSTAAQREAMSALLRGALDIEPLLTEAEGGKAP